MTCPTLAHLDTQWGLEWVSTGGEALPRRGDLNGGAIQAAGKIIWTLSIFCGTATFAARYPQSTLNSLSALGSRKRTVPVATVRRATPLSTINHQPSGPKACHVIARAEASQRAEARVNNTQFRSEA